MILIDNSCKTFYRIDEDFIFFVSNDIYYLIKESFTLIKLTLSYEEFYEIHTKHIKENVSLLSLISTDFELVENFIIEKKEVYE